jgi:hypothetical protein
MRDLFIAGSFSLAATLAPFAAALAPQDGVPVAVILAPWADTGEAVEVVAAAQGSLLAASGSGRVAIARADAPGFAARLYAAGAALVIDAGAAAGCLTLPTPLSIATPRGHL